jgi:IS5 family transposase
MAQQRKCSERQLRGPGGQHPIRIGFANVLFAHHGIPASIANATTQYRQARSRRLRRRKCQPVRMEQVQASRTPHSGADGSAAIALARLETFGRRIDAMPEKPLFEKMHLAVDHGSGLVRRANLTSGHISDKLPFLDLVQGDERAVYADKGYDGWWYRRELARRGIADGITTGHYRQRQLDAAGHARNRTIRPIRAPIERTFPILKRWYGYDRSAIGVQSRTALSCSCSPSRSTGAAPLVLGG